MSYADDAMEALREQLAAAQQEAATERSLRLALARAVRDGGLPQPLPEYGHADLFDAVALHQEAQRLRQEAEELRAQLATARADALQEVREKVEKAIDEQPGDYLKRHQILALLDGGTA